MLLCFPALEIVPFMKLGSDDDGPDRGKHSRQFFLAYVGSVPESHCSQWQVIKIAWRVCDVDRAHEHAHTNEGLSPLCLLSLFEAFWLFWRILSCYLIKLHQL